MYYGYIRVSTKTQSEKGYGLDAQRAEIEKYAAAHGYDLTRIFADAGISANIEDEEDAAEQIKKREALLEMISALQPGDTVIVLNTSRLWRSDSTKALVLHELKRREAKVISIEQPTYDLYRVSKDPGAYIVNAIMEALDVYDRLSLSIKLSRGRITKAKGGDKPSGAAPLGYKYSADKKSIVIDEEAAPIVKLMFSEAQKGKSLRELAAILNEKGIPTRRGKAWTAGTVQSVLHNRFYIGEMTYDTEEIKKAPGYEPRYKQGNQEPLISKIQFGKVQRQLEKRRR